MLPISKWERGRFVYTRPCSCLTIPSNQMWWGKAQRKTWAWSVGMVNFGMWNDLPSEFWQWRIPRSSLDNGKTLLSQGLHTPHVSSTWYGLEIAKSMMKDSVCVNHDGKGTRPYGQKSAYNDSTCPEEQDDIIDGRDGVIWATVRPTPNRTIWIWGTSGF